MCSNCENERRGGGGGGGGSGGVEVEVKILGRGVGFSCRWNCFLSTELEHIFEKMCGSVFFIIVFLCVCVCVCFCFY